MASIRIIFHQSPSIRPPTGKHGELSLATHRAQPHPRQPRYQLQNVWLSPLRNTIVHNSTVLQNTVFYHYVSKAVTLSSHLYKHYILHTIYLFFRARESRELARKRSAPRELQATTELRYPSGRPAISSRYRTATMAVPFDLFACTATVAVPSPVLILSPRPRGYSSERVIMKPSKRGLLIAPLRAQSPPETPRAGFEREVTIVIVTVKS